VYPHPQHEARIAGALSDALGDDALVVARDELSGTGLTGRLPEGAGEVVVVATGSRFPVPDAMYRFEHGSATAAEMVVPLAVWRAR
jgi:hypothetical protein